MDVWMICAIILIAWLGWDAVKFVRVIAKMFKCYSEIRLIKKQSIPAIKLIDVWHSKENHTVNFLWSGAFFGLVILGFYFYTNVHFDIYGLIIISITFVIPVCGFLRDYLHYKYGKFAFLTPTLLVSIDGIYKKDRYRFEIETETLNAGDSDSYLNVYKEKSQYPLRFRIVEKVEETVEMIHEYYE